MKVMNESDEWKRWEWSIKYVIVIVSIEIRAISVGSECKLGMWVLDVSNESKLGMWAEH